MSLEAASQQAALEALHRDGCFVMMLKSGGNDAPIAQRLKSLKRARMDELVAFSREFAVMVRAGVPILESLRALGEHMKPGVLKESLDQVKAEVEEGRSLSEAMRRRPTVFPKLYVNLVQAAETGGNLDTILKRAADYLNEALGLQRRVKSAMMYPASILIATMFAFAYMIAFIMPKFAEMFKQMKVDLPVTTQALVFLGTLGDRYKIIALASPLVVLIALYGLWQLPKFREPVGYWIARLPMVGDLTRKVVLTRSLSALQTLIASGVNLGRSIEIAAETSGDRRMERALTKVKMDAESGLPLAHSMKETNEFPTIVLQLVAAGEKTGALPEMLGEVVEFYDDEVQQRLKGLTSILEPIMVLALGVVIGVFAMSVISPIYSLMGNIK